MPGYNDPTSATGWTLGSLIAPNVSELADRLFPPILRRLGELPDDALVEGETIEELALVSLHQPVLLLQLCNKISCLGLK